MAGASPVSLGDSVARLKGVGPSVAEALARLGLRTIRDVVFHLPLRYQDRTRCLPVEALRPGAEVVVEGTVLSTQVQFGRRRSLLCRIEDESGALQLRFFHFNRSQQQRLETGRTLRCFGEVRRGVHGLEMVHPEVQVISDAGPVAVDTALTPVYPATEGLHQARLRSLASQALDILRREAGNADPMEAFLARHWPGRSALPSLAQALIFVHRPPPDAPVETLWEGRHPAQQRLALEELLAHQLGLRQIRQHSRHHAARPLSADTALRGSLCESLGFALTDAQRRVVAEIDADLARAHPMLRLVQGDVGAGKTAVAALAAASALASGHQVVMMAPTELLAEQHARTFSRWFTPLGIDVVPVSGKQTGRTRRDVRAAMQAPGARCFVGTHALFQDDVAYADLALVIVDEQHRFGVDQRLALLEKGAQGGLRPHQLIMTATPIPRTLAMTAYADLDVSVLDELPPGRTPVRTTVLPAARREDVASRVAASCREGRQAYWVCPLIEESEHLDSQAATDTAQALATQMAPLRVGLIHGRLADKDKQAVMSAFLAGDIDVLVATTVIEVGVDVPNASLMIIENAERLGLSQLHQLRGRVGRGSAQSDCVLLFQAPLSETAAERLKTMRETNDGFLIAERDLALRGPGEVLGTRQTGLAGYRIADLGRDRDLLPVVQEVADDILHTAPALIPTLLERWVVQRIDYAKV